MKIALLLLLTVVLTLGLTPAFAGSASDRTLNPEWHKCAKSTGDYGYGAEVFCAKKGIDKYISKKQSTTSYSVRDNWEPTAKSNYAWNNWNDMPTAKSNYASKNFDSLAIDKSSFMYKYLNNLGTEKSYTIPEIKPAPQIYKSPEIKPAPQIYKSPEYNKPIEENFGQGISANPTSNTWGTCGWFWCW